MIGSGLKKLARKNSMTIASGIAYGDFNGYAATFSERSGYRILTFTTSRLNTASWASSTGAISKRNFAFRSL